MKFKINQIQKSQKQDLSYTFGKMEEADVYFTEKFTDFRDFSKTEPHHLDLGFNICKLNSTEILNLTAPNLYYSQRE